MFEYTNWLYQVFKYVNHQLNDDGSVFLNIAGSSLNPLLPHKIAILLSDIFVLQNTIVWVKSISIDHKTSGHFKPINSKRFLNHNHEYVFHFTKTGKVEIDRLAIGVPFQDKSNIARRNHAVDRRCAGNNWFIPYPTVKSKKDKFNHPATFPLELAERCIKLHGKKGLVLDPFLGIGTTLLAAKNLGYSGIGIDIDSKYIKTAKARLK